MTVYHVIMCTCYLYIRTSNNNRNKNCSVCLILKFLFTPNFFFNVIVLYINFVDLNQCLTSSVNLSHNKIVERLLKIYTFHLVSFRLIYIL